MQIILLSRFCNKTGGFHLCRLNVLLTVLLLGGAACGGLIFLGYCVGVSNIPVTTQDTLISKLRGELERERVAREQSHRRAEEQVNALAMSLGQLQAHIYRLNALGTRLTKMIDLDNGEFDFSQPPAQGGPETALDSESLNAPDLVPLLDALAKELEDREAQLTVLADLLTTRDLKDKARPAGRPVRSGWVSSRFGKRIHPLTGKKDYHKGIDFAGKAGSDVMAVASGVITWSGKRYGYGELVEISHGNRYVTRYAHNQERLVDVGETVKKGQVIARMGSTGKSTGPHVHFEILHNRRAVDPAKYIWASR